MKFHHIGYLTNNLRLSVNDFKKLNYRKIKKPVIDNNLKVKIQFLKNRNNIIEKKPKIPILPKVIAQGNKNAISKSKIINNIATK